MAFLSFSLETERMPADVAQQIQAITRAPALREVVDLRHPFRGEVQRGGFRLRQITQLRHYVYPFLVGTISRAPGGSRVEVRVRPSWGAWILLLMVMGFIGVQGGTVPLLAALCVGLPFMLLGSHVLAQEGEALLSRVLATGLNA